MVAFPRCWMAGKMLEIGLMRYRAQQKMLVKYLNATDQH